MKESEALIRTSANARTFARPDAAERIAKRLIAWAEAPAGAAHAGEA